MKRMMITGIAGGALGAVAFWYYQVTFQGGTIPAYIGAQIVSQGKYALSPAWVGWGVHLGVSISYAFLLGLILTAVFPRSFVLNRSAGLAAALALGWLTTLIAAPAIQITIALLAGKGFPAKLLPLSSARGHTFWNHLLFFALIWAFDTGLALYMKNRGRGNGRAPSPDSSGGEPSL